MVTKACRFAVFVLTVSVVPALQAEIDFTDVTEIAGIEPDMYNSFTGHSLGVNWIDFDRDGWEDLYFVNGYDDPDDAFETRHHLYRNNRDGTFTKVDFLLPPLPNFDGSGSKFADYDNDGDLDIYVYTDNRYADPNGPNPKNGPPNWLLKNLWVENGNAVIPGQPLFEEVAAEAGVADGGYRSKAAQWLDYDLDSCIDLYVGHWVLSHDGDQSNKDRLFHNNCDGTFEDVTDISGMYEDPTADFHPSFRAALAVIAGFFDKGDIYPDLFVVNTSGGVPGMHIPEGHIDQIFRNNGDGTFTEVFFPGVGDDAQAGMGIDFADIDHDGGFDFYISDLIRHSRPACEGCELEESWPFGNPLYLNDGITIGDDVAEQAGVIGASSWGVNFFDADHDTWEDLFVSVGMDSMGEPSLMFRNNGDGTFTSVLGDFQNSDARGSAAADYDRDGDIDIALVNQRGIAQLWRNDTPDQGNWIQFHLVATQSVPDAIGALVKVQLGSKTLMRQIKGGSSGHGQDSLIVHFGLGDATVIDRVTVLWPGGQVSTRTNWGPVNRRYTITEPSP